MSSPIVGIDLGTTHSLIGVMDAGFPILLANAQGERLTPSVVHFPAEGEPLVGRAASRMRLLEPTRTLYSVKRLIGRRAGEAGEETADLPYQLTGQPGAPLRIALPGGNEPTPEAVSALILAQLKRQAETALEMPLTRAVITVPAYFNDAQRNATKAAGEAAGFQVERIINEPTAAALAYGLDKLGEKARVAVYDLGGGTFDISILELDNGIFTVRATNGNTRLGGDDIDRALVGWLAEAITEAFGVKELSPAALSRVREAAIDAKHRLSETEETSVELPFLEEGKSFQTTLHRSRLEALARPVVEATRNHCIRVLADAGITAADLDEIILVGGQTRMPLVRQWVADFFGREPNTSQNPDEAVALGATIQAGILSGAVQNVVLLDVTPLSLGIETFGGLMNVIIPRNSTIPTKAGELFTNAVAGQRSVLIRVLQGERELANDNWELGRFELAFDASEGKGQARVGVQFEIDANGILHVLARDVKTGREQIVEMRSAVDVSDEAVETMIAESLEHAFEDMAARVYTEARIKAEEMLPAVRNALGTVGDQLDAGERERIETAVGDVEAALEAENPNALKKATTTLDRATQNLATLVMEAAMEAALRRKGLL
ncbi:MAG TPA: molecular chaperone DnaK [Chthoniobacteraceae bacterium]|nr:molecular chaperone DnaK [Chthoniobacteraceae bacterium]